MVTVVTCVCALLKKAKMCFDDGLDEVHLTGDDAFTSAVNKSFPSVCVLMFTRLAFPFEVPFSWPFFVVFF